LAIFVVPLLLISTATGFLRANQKWYWEEGYKKKKQASGFTVDKDVVSVNRIIHLIDSVSSQKNIFTEINLISENKHPYYKILTSSKEKYLLDAYTGDIISPLSFERASSFAKQYVKGNPSVKSCEFFREYLAGKSKEKRPAYKVSFENNVHSQIFLDYYSGEILEDIDDNRRLGIWIVKLHDYNFFNSKRGITSVVGALILLLSLSGLWIYKIRLKKKNKLTE
jgi:uncharacterized membrane protein YkoI